MRAEAATGFADEAKVVIVLRCYTSTSVVVVKVMSSILLPVVGTVICSK